MSGNKLKVYIIMKILKQCTDAPLTSFAMKFAVHNALANIKYEKQDIGPSLKRALRYTTVSGQFMGVEVTLKEIGVNRVEYK